MSERAYKLGLIVALLATGVALVALGDRDAASMAFVAAGLACVLI